MRWFAYTCVTKMYLTSYGCIVLCNQNKFDQCAVFQTHHLTLPGLFFATLCNHDKWMCVCGLQFHFKCSTCFWLLYAPDEMPLMMPAVFLPLICLLLLNVFVYSLPAGMLLLRTTPTRSRPPLTPYSRRPCRWVRPCTSRKQQQVANLEQKQVLSNPAAHPAADLVTIT